MKQLNVKKLVLLNLPYFLLGLFATNLGEAWRLATGADASAQMLSFFSTLPVALGSWWPSLHPVSYTHLVTWPPCRRVALAAAHRIRSTGIRPWCLPYR